MVRRARIFSTVPPCPHPAAVPDPHRLPPLRVSSTSFQSFSCTSTCRKACVFLCIVPQHTTLLLLRVHLIQPVSVEKRSHRERLLADLLLCRWSIHFIHPPSWAFELLDLLLLHTTLQPLAVCSSLHLSYTCEVPSQKWNCGVRSHLQVTTSSLDLVAPFDE